MTQRTNSVQSCPIVSDERMRNELRKALHSALHIERCTTRQKLENDSGVNIYTIDAILSTDPAKQRPIHAHQMLSLAFAAGPRAVNTIMALIGYSGTPLDNEDDVRPMQIVAGLTRQLSTIATAAADGRIDHVELPACIQAADEIITIVTPLSSAGQS